MEEELSAVRNEIGECGKWLCGCKNGCRDDKPTKPSYDNNKEVCDK